MNTPYSGDPYLSNSVTSSPEVVDNGKMMAFVTGAANSIERENIGAVAFNTTKYFAAGLYGSPEVDESMFDSVFVTQNPNLKGKWKPGMRMLQAQMLLDDQALQEVYSYAAGSNVVSALGGALAGGFVDPANIATMGMGGVGGIARGTSALARTGRALQKLGRMVAPDAASGAGVGARALAGARQGVVEWAATEPLAYIAQDKYLQQDRDAMDLAVSFVASSLLPVAAHSLARKVGPDPLGKRNAAMKESILQNELDPASVDPKFLEAMDNMPARRAPGELDSPRRDQDIYETEVRSVFQRASDSLKALKASSSDPAVLKRIADTEARIDAERIRMDREGLIGPSRFEKAGPIGRKASDILAELESYRPKPVEKPDGVGTALKADSVDKYLIRLEKFLSDEHPEISGHLIDSTSQLPSRPMLPLGPDKQSRIKDARRAATAPIARKLNQMSVDLDGWVARKKALVPKGDLAATGLRDISTIKGLVSMIETWSGRKVRFYQGADAEAQFGKFGSTIIHTPDTVFINGDIGSTGMIMHTIGHELYHTLVYQNPKMAQAIEQAFLGSGSAGKSIRESLEQWGTEAFEDLHPYMRGEELTANAVGQMLNSPEFYKMLAEKLGESGFKKVIAYITERLRDLRRLLSGTKEHRHLTQELFGPVYKAMQSTKEGKAWFEGPQDLLEYRNSHWSATRRGWSGQFNAAFAAKYRLDDAFDKWNEDFSVRLPDEAGDTSERIVYHNNTEFTSNGITIPLSDDLVRMLQASPDRDTLVYVYEQALRSKEAVTKRVRETIESYKKKMGDTGMDATEALEKFNGQRRQYYVREVDQFTALLKKSTDSTEIKELRTLLANAESVLADYDKWALAKAHMERPAYAWQLRGNSLSMMVSQAPVTGTRASTLSPFSRAMAQANELISAFNLWSKDYDGAPLSFTKENENLKTDLAIQLDQLGTHLARTLAGADPLLSHGVFQTEGGRKRFALKRAQNDTEVDVSDFAERAKSNGSPELLSDFLQSREFESIFINGKTESGAKAVDPQVQANRYYEVFMESLDEFTNRKRNELQADQDPDLLAVFETWQDRVKEFHRDSGKFTTKNAAIYDLEKAAKSMELDAPATRQAEIEKAFKDIETTLNSFKRDSATNQTMSPASASVTDAMDELKAMVANKTGEAPHNLKPSALINQSYELASKVPAVIRSHYIDTGLAANYHKYKNHLDVAAMRAFWDDLLDTDLDNPMSLYSDKVRELTDGVDRMSETADRLSRELESLERIKREWPKGKALPDDLANEIEVKSADLSDLHSRVVAGYNLTKTYAGSLENSYGKEPITRNGLTMTRAQHDAFNGLLTQYGEVEVYRFLQWKGADLLETFDAGTQAAIAAEYKRLTNLTAADGPEVFSIREGEDIVGGKVLSNEALNEADDAAQRSAEFGGSGYEGSLEMDRMPAKKAQDDRIKGFGDYAAPDAVKISKAFMADLPKFMAPIEALAKLDPAFDSALKGIKKAKDRAASLKNQVSMLLDPNSPNGFNSTYATVTNGGVVHPDSAVDDIIRRGFATASSPADALKRIEDDLEVHNTKLVRKQVLDSYGRATLHRKAGTLSELKTLMDGVSRITSGFFGKENYQNSTRPVYGVVDAQMKTARIEAVAQIQSLINQLPGEVRSTPDTSAVALKAILNSPTAANTDPAFKSVYEAIQGGIEYARGRMNRAGAMVAKLDNFFMSQRHELSRIEKDVPAWINRMIRASDWDKISKRVGGDLSNVKAQTDYLNSMLSDLRNAAIQGDTVAWDVELDNLASRDRFHRIHEFRSTDEAVDYDMAYGSGDTMNEMVNQIARRAERSVAMENFGPSYIENFRSHMAYLKSKAPKPKGKIGQMLQDWSFTRTRHTFEHLTGVLNNPVNQRVAAMGQTVRMLSSAAFGWMTTPSSITDLAHTRAALRHMGAKNHWGFVQGLSDFAKDSSRYPAEYKARLEATGATYSTLLSAAARGDTEYAGKGLSRKGNDFIYTANLQRRWVRNLQTGFADVFVKHLADMADHVKQTGEFDEAFGVYAKHYNLTKEELLAAGNFMDSVDTDGSGVLNRVIIPAEITNQKLRAKIQTMMLDTMDHAVLQPSVADTAFLTFGTRAGTVTGEIVRTMMQFKGFSLAMNSRMRRRYRAYGMSDLAVNKMNVDRMYHGASLVAMGLLATQIKDALNGKEPLHFMNEDQRTAANVHRVFMQAGLFTALSDLGLEIDYKEGQGLRAGMSTQLLGPAIGQVSRFVGQVTAEDPNAGNRAISTLLNATPGATLPVWNSVKRELFGAMVYEAYGIHLDAVVARQESLTGQTQGINF